MRLAFVFPGQGSQSVGMLNGFSGNAVVEDYVRRADAALGFPISKLIEEGPAEELGLTVNTQPALLTASVAFYEAWLAAGGMKPSRRRLNSSRLKAAAALLNLLFRVPSIRAC